MENGFNKEGFINWLKEEFPGVIDTYWNYDLVENIIDYATKNKKVSKDQLSYFISDILLEVEFLEVARFCYEFYLTDRTLKQLGRI